MNAETEDGGGYLLYRLADLQLTRGQVREAHQLAQQSVDVEKAKHGDYQYLTAAMIVLGQAMEAQNDLAGARAQFEQALAMRKGIGAQGGVAEGEVDLAELAVEEGHPERAEPLLREAVAEFDKEGSDPSGSSALTLLSRVLLMEGKLEEARKTAQRGAELSLTSSDPALRLPAEIQQARVEMAAKAHGSTAASLASGRLQNVIATARSLGYYNIEQEARLAAAELQLSVNASAARKQLTQLAAEARSQGFEQTARQAELALTASVQVVSLPAH
jgi:tetratricopeptide (TPR) repeat protein